MKVETTPLPGVLLITPQVYRDARGYFLESYHQERYREHGLPAAFVQDNISSSSRGILRGLHLQWRKPQGKLVRVLRGEVFDVAVDLRPSSRTFKQWYGMSLHADTFQQLYIPPGFAHGFCVISDHAEVFYKVTEPYDPGGELTVRWDDPEIAIAWPIEHPILSPKDSAGLLLKEALPRLTEIRDKSIR